MAMKGSHSEEAKARMRAASQARWADPEYRARVMAARMARPSEARSASAKKGAAAAAKVLRGSKKTPEQIARAVEGRRANNGGRYFPQGGSAAVHMSPGPAPDKVYKRTPEQRAAMSERKQKDWAAGKYVDRVPNPNPKPATRRRVSRMEMSLVPYLEALGYEHVDADNPFFVYHPEKGMVPDFVDRAGRRVFEFFGDYWHPPTDEADTIRRYAESGWTCTVLWEHDLEAWIGSQGC